MAKIYQITIPKFLEKQKKISKNLRAILIDKNIHHEMRVYSKEAFDLYFYLLLNLDNEATFVGKDTDIKRDARLPRRCDIEKLLQELSQSVGKMSPKVLYDVISDTNRSPNGNQLVTKTTKNDSTIYKDVLNKRNKEINKQASDQDSLAEKEVNEILGLFKPIDETYSKHFKNKTQRLAVKTLVKTVGRSRLEDVLKQLPSLLADKYCPKITTPCDLLRDWGKLDKYIKQVKPELKTTQEQKSKCRVCKGNGFTTYHGAYACPFCELGKGFAKIGRYSIMPEEIKQDIENQLVEVA